MNKRRKRSSLASRSDYGWVLLVVAAVASGMHWSILSSQSGIFRRIPGYFWHFMAFHLKPMPSAWLLPFVAIIAGAVIVFVLRRPMRTILNLALLILLGYGIQLTFGFVDGDGIESIRRRTVATGHAEFARIAALDLPVIQSVSNYEEILRQNDSLRYVHTKPPGHLAFYQLTGRAADLAGGSNQPEERFERLTHLAAWTWPIVCYLVLIPLYLFARLFTDQRAALIACVLYLFVPSVALVVLHLDQVLYPLLFMLTTYLAALAQVRLKPLLAVAAGAMLAVCLFVSFSLLPAIPMAALAVFAVSNRSFRWPGAKPALITLAWIAGGALALSLILWLGLNYNPLQRYSASMAYHAQWKAWEGGLGPTLLFAGLNFIEFFLWTGIPLSISFLGHATPSAVAAARRTFTPIAIISLSTLALLLLIGLLGKTKGEVARLWIFLIPLVCLTAADFLATRLAKKLPLVLALVIALQGVTIIVIKRFQDFW